MKILFLDDDPDRTAKFKQRMIGHAVTCVATPEEAFEALDRHSRFDIASLDHDLFGKIYQPSDDKSGFAVCSHIDEMMNDEDQPKKVVCHSYNEDGVATMMALLGGLPLESCVAPFDSDGYWSTFGESTTVGTASDSTRVSEVSKLD